MKNELEHFPSLKYDCLQKRRAYILLLSFLTLFGVCSAYGQSINEYLILAAESNPALKAKFIEYQASLEKVSQVGALSDPQLSFGFFIKPMERYAGDQVAEISLMQMFPWFGTLGAAKNEAALMAKAKYEAFIESKTMLFYEVKATWYALYLLEKEIAITEENIQILQSLEEIAINRFKSGGTSGGGSMVDVLRVQMETNESKNKLALLRDNRQQLAAQFNKLLNRPSGEVVIMPDRITAPMLPVPVAQIPDSIRQNNPMLKMLKMEEEAFLAQEQMNRKMGFPMIGIGLQYGIFQPRPGNESMMNGHDMLMPMATVSIPLWRKKYNASVKEAGFMREAVIEQRQEAGNQLLVSHEEALKDYRDATRRVELYQQQTVLAQQALNILTVQYATAGSAFEEVLRMQQQLLDYRLRGLDSIVDQNIAIAMLERLMGR